MNLVEIYAAQGAVVLRAKGNELLVLPLHVEQLQKLTDLKSFSDYFTLHAMVNRPARKLFLAWIRKDPNLWQRLYKTIHSKKEKEETTADS